MPGILLRENIFLNKLAEILRFHAFLEPKKPTS